MASHLREGDAEQMLRVLAEAREDTVPGPAVPWALLEGLQLLVPCDWDVAYQHHDFMSRRTELVQCVDTDGTRGVESDAAYDDYTEAFWDLWWSSECSWPQRSGDLRSVVHTGDFHPTERDRLADPMSEVLSITACMIVSMPAEPGHARRFTFMRGDGTPFTERDRQVLSLLRPHLYELWVDAERRRAGVPPLTQREWQVLALVGCGLSFAQVAQRLVISVATVRKHMEHVRERLGVSSAAAAAAVALPLAPAGGAPLNRRPRPRAVGRAGPAAAAPARGRAVGVRAAGPVLPAR
jgi:DNA-binding CsgD family transcriptional regulator